MVSCLSLNSPVWLAKQYLDLLRLEIADDGRACLFERQGQYPLELRDVKHVLLEEMAKEASDRGESNIARADAVVAIRLEVVEKSKNAIDGQIFESKFGHRTLGLLSEEGEEQPQGIAVGKNRVSTHSPGLLQVVPKEGLDQTQKRI